MTTGAPVAASTSRIPLVLDLAHNEPAGGDGPPLAQGARLAESTRYRRICSPVHPGANPAITAATALTCGAAIEVPNIGPYPPPTFVLITSFPGAAKSTDFAPYADGINPSA